MSYDFDFIPPLKVLIALFTFFLAWKFLNFLYTKFKSIGIQFLDGSLPQYLSQKKWRIETQIFREAFLFILDSARWGLRLFFFYLLCTAILVSIPSTAASVGFLVESLVSPLEWLGHKFVEILPNLFFILVISILVVYLLKVVRFVFQNLKAERIVIEGFHAEWAETTYKLVRGLLLLIALVVCFPYIPGSESPAFKALSVFFGVLISIGSSSSIGNMMAGLLITYMRPFKAGDRVKIADTVGDIVSKDLLVTRVRTIKNVEITIPNSMILSHHIVNYSTLAQNEGVLLNSTITIGYDALWSEVESALIEAARRTKHIDLEKPPFVLQTALNDFHISYEINVWTRKPENMAVIYSDLHRNIQIVFAERKIEIMSPNYHAVRDGNRSTIPLL